MRVFRIVVADDHPVFRLGLCALLERHAGWRVCGEASDGRDAVEKCRQLKPDLLVLDISMPQLNGLGAARQILKADPSQRILILTDVNADGVIRECLDAGVRGWVFKSDTANDLHNAVEALLRGRCSLSSRMSSLIRDAYLQRNPACLVPAKVSTLSLREREVVQLVGEGRSTKQVATLLNVTAKTAGSHRASIMRKLKVHSVAELVLYAVRNGIVDASAPAVRA